LALEGLEKSFPNFLLDLGTGSGILALAASNIWPNAKVIASDNDMEAIHKAIENTQINKNRKIEFFISEGFEHPAFLGVSFDLIIANILAGPLVDLAPEISGHLKPGGLVILAGLLEGQKEEVLKAYHSEGFILKNETSENGWPTLTLQKG